MFSVWEWKKSEVVVVAGIILVILGISSFQLVVGEMKTRDVQRKADVELVSRALQVYFEDYQVYPAATAGGQIVACGDKGARPCVWGSGDSMVDHDNVVYLKGMPTDPLADRGWKYVYVVDEKRDKYRIYVGLEYERDPEARQNLTVGCGTGVQCKWYVGNY